MKNNDELKQTIISKCDALKKELLSKIEPEEKTKLEAGKWYKSTAENCKRLWFMQDIIDKFTQISYGFNLYGEWHNLDTRNSSVNELTEATQSEVETALINEAKKRGLVKGVKVSLDNFYHGTDNPIIENNNYEYIDNCLTIQNKEGFNVGLYKLGKWATIITEKTSEEWAKEYHDSVTNLPLFLSINNLKIVKQ